MPDFWLVTTFESIDVKEKLSMASAKVYSKWHFRDSNFLEKVKDGRRALKNGVEALSEEKRIALAEPNGLLASGEMLKGFVIEDGTATKLSTPRLSPTKAKSTIFNSGAPPPVQTQSSSYENPSLTFPVSLDSIFANHVGAPELLYSKCWVQYNPKTACVSVQLAFNVSVHAFSDNFSDSFPYDRHIIPFQIETRAWKTADGVREGWTLLKEVPDWAPKKYDEDKTIITEGMTTADLELKSEPPFAELSDKRPLLCLRKERIPNILFRRQGLPVFIIVLLALLIFFIRGRTIEMEYAAVSASFLTFTAYTLTVNDVLGHTNSKLTYVDHYFSLAYIYYVVITLKIMAVSMTCGELAEFDHDEYSKDSRTDLGWHLMPMALVTVVDVLITVVFFKLHHLLGHLHFLVNAVLLVVGFAAAVTGLSYLYLPAEGDERELGWCQNVDFFGTAVLVVFWLGLHVAMKWLAEPFWRKESLVRVPWPELLIKIKEKLRQLQETKYKTAGFVWPDDATKLKELSRTSETSTPAKRPTRPPGSRSSEVAVSPGVQAVLRDVQNSGRLAACSSRTRGAAMH